MRFFTYSLPEFFAFFLIYRLQRWILKKNKMHAFQFQLISFWYNRIIFLTQKKKYFWKFLTQKKNHGIECFGVCLLVFVLILVKIGFSLAYFISWKFHHLILKTFKVFSQGLGYWNSLFNQQHTFMRKCPFLWHSVDTGGK